MPFFGNDDMPVYEMSAITDVDPARFYALSPPVEHSAFGYRGTESVHNSPVPATKNS